MRKFIIILSGLCLVLLLGYAAFRGYGIWKEKHWLSMAREFAAKGDVPNESLCLQQVFRINSHNLEAYHLAANLAEAEDSDTALMWRQRVFELDPNSLDNRLAFAQTAIFVNDLDIAANALAGTDAAGKKTADYLSVAGELALALGRRDEAQANFSEALRMDPSNPAIQMDLALVEVLHTNELDVSEGRIALKRLSLNPTNSSIRYKAKRELTVDALRHKDFSTALLLSSDLAKETNATFADKLLWLESLRSSKNASYASVLTGYENEAVKNQGKLRQLTIWLIERDLQGVALSWLLNLPLQVQTNQPGAVLIAQCQMLAQDWNGLQKMVSKQAWGDLEFTRHAYIARALREQGLDGASKAEWDVAFKGANNQLGRLSALEGMTSAWKWPTEQQQCLWAIINADPRQQRAVAELAGELYALGSTRPLMQLFQLQYNRNSADLDAENNLAMCAMLLKANELRPYDLARDVYQKAPTNVNFTVTYAFSLYLQGKKDEALKKIQSIDNKDFNVNSRSGYYGVILNATGDRSKAAPYLRRSTTGPLLPEERALFEQALMGR